MTVDNERPTSWENGYVDTGKEHIVLLHGEIGTEMQQVALLAPSGSNQFTVQFLIQNNKANTEVLQDVTKQLNFFLIEKKEPNPWAYVMYHTHTSANMYGKVHWGYYPPNPNVDEISANDR